VAASIPFVGSVELIIDENPNLSDETPIDLPYGDLSPDREDRMRDFFTRHGGPSADPLRHVETEHGTRGWSEVYARDGYALRCDWSRAGGKEHMQFVELSQHSPA